MWPIGWSEIRFDQGESKEIVRMRAPGGISDEVMSAIYDRAQGWVSGLLLMIEGLKTTEVDYRVGAELSPREVFRYFASEIFDKAGQDTKHFLLKTAFLPTMTAESAERLTGTTRSGRFLSSLYENRFFIEKYAGPKMAYRYHPLFRDYLLSTATDFFSPEEIAEIQRQAAGILLEAGQKEEAVRLLESAKEWGTAIPVVISLAPGLLAEGRARTLEEWIETIPTSERSRVPWSDLLAGYLQAGLQSDRKPVAA